MKDEKKAPKLRFKGFTDDWEQCKLGRILKKNIERNKNSRYGNDKTISISKMRYNPQGTGASSESLTNYKVIRIGDVAFEGHTNREFQYGRFVVNDLGDGIMSPRFSVLRPVGPFNISYWKQYLHCERYINRILVRSTKAGTMMNELVYNDLSKEFVYCPSNNEQQKIGKLLSKVDFAITLHEEKKHQLEQLKSALLQKMFADKSGYPDVRFEDFSGEWEQCKLGNVAKITMGQSPNSKNYTDNPKDRILVQGNADMKDGQVHPRIWTTEITKTANKGDLILSVRAPVGDIGKTSYDVVIGRGVAAIKGNEFIFQLLKRMKAVGYWTKYSTGSTFKSINSLEINNAVINLPREHEQNEVGNILYYVDHAITLQNYKIELVKKLKSSLLQNMFI